MKNVKDSHYQYFWNKYLKHFYNRLLAILFVVSGICRQMTFQLYRQDCSPCWPSCQACKLMYITWQNFFIARFFIYSFLCACVKEGGGGGGGGKKDVILLQIKKPVHWPIISFFLIKACLFFKASVKPYPQNALITSLYIFSSRRSFNRFNNL